MQQDPQSAQLLLNYWGSQILRLALIQRHTALYEELDPDPDLLLLSQRPTVTSQHRHLLTLTCKRAWWTLWMPRLCSWRLSLMKAWEQRPRWRIELFRSCWTESKLEMTNWSRHSLIYKAATPRFWSWRRIWERLSNRTLRSRLSARNLLSRETASARSTKLCTSRSLLSNRDLRQPERN